MITFDEREVLAVMTRKVDRYGRVTCSKRYRGKVVRIFILARDPDSPQVTSDGRPRQWKL